MKSYYRIIPFLLLFVIATTSALQAQTRNGFDLTGAVIPAEEILSGGPPRDGIPAIVAPRFIEARDAGYMKGEQRVLGVTRNGVSKAYPIAIMNWHEIVNDRFGREAIVVTFCPLCGTGVAYSSSVAGKALSFGVSGLLYNSDVLLYDRGTESLWSQLLSKSISGPLKGTELTKIPLSHTTWHDWRARHPETLLLSRDTGYFRNYRKDPYEGYEENRRIFFPVSHHDARYHPKERVVGIEVDGRTKAYPFVELARTSGQVVDTFAGRELLVTFDGQNQSGAVFHGDGREIPSVTAFWFAWVAFHPETEVFTAK